MKRLILIAVLLAGLASEAQVNHLIITVATGTSSTVPALLRLPNWYTDSTTKKFPLIVFGHGAGQAGTNLASIYNSSTAGGPAYFIENGGWPETFTNPAGGTDQFIVVSPQANNSWFLSGDQINYTVKYMVDNYRIDTSRIYLMGLSAGGDGMYQYITHQNVAQTSWTQSRFFKIRAAVIMNQASNSPDQTRANVAVADSTFVWGFGDQINDVHGVKTQTLTTLMNNTRPGIAKFTGNADGYTGGHCCWNTYLNPTYTATKWGSSMSVYQFLLYIGGPSSNAWASSTTPPTANAGLDQTLIWPQNYCTLYGGHPSFSAKSANGGPITSWVWSKISGPGTAEIDKYKDYTDNATSVDSAVFIKGLSLGTHQFELTITDSAGGTDKDTVQVVVQNCTYNPSPKTITITANVYNPFNFASAYNVLPGDIVQIDASQVDSLDNFIVGNVHGCPGQPIIIKPINGMLNIGTIKFSNTGEGVGNNKSSWIHLDGSGVPGQTYGIKARQFVIGTAHHIEMNNIWSDNSGQVGIVIAPYENATPKSLDRMFPVHYMTGIYLHDFKVTGSWNEGVYGGGSTPQTFVGYSDPINARGDSLYIYNGEIDSCGQDGIQVSSFYHAWVYNNFLNRPAKNNVTGHGTGISIGSGVMGKVWNNIIRKSANQGILVSGHDSIEVWNNYLDSCSFLNQNPATFPAIIYTSFGKYTHEGWKPQKVYIHHNYIRDPWNLRDIEVTDYLSLADPAKVDSNTFYLENYSSGFPGSYILLSASPGSTQAGNVRASFTVPAWQKSVNYKPTLMNPSGVVSGGGGQQLQGGARFGKRGFRGIKTKSQ